MAIFVALIFQVLFVFFAMAINVGLVVHDKINLQNSADLAAYYVAQRQAEWLNVMAHQNYQIRQSFKVYAWRYRVLGTMGRTNHPAKGAGATADALYSEAVAPAVCVSYKPNFLGIPGEDNICKDAGLNVPAISLPIGFGPINAALVIFTGKINESIQALCENYGGINYFYTNAMRYAFQLDQMRLKKSILKIAENLSKPFNEMIDLNGGNVYMGAKKTFEKNLTFENRANFEVVAINSIAKAPFNNPEAWLNELKIRVQSIYRDVKTNGGCFSVDTLATQPPAENSAWNLITGQTGLDPATVQGMFAEPSPTVLDRLSLGFEKNPWVRLYVKVTAQSRPRQVFFPFGDPITMTATAYAQPFGGSIGPWNKDAWQKGAPSSNGTELDGLLPPLVVSGSGAVATPNDPRLLPNYSRAPGDTMGMASALAQSVLGGSAGITASFPSILGAMRYGPGIAPDPLSWSPPGAAEATTVRKYEIMAAAPDLFDIAYYSIEPNFGRTYLPKLQQVANALGIEPADIPRPDLGGRVGVDGLSDFSVQDQMAVASGKIPYPGEPAPQNFQNPTQYWVVRDRAHLLTSWVPNNEIAEYLKFPDGKFASCNPQGWDDDFKVKIPGSCILNGGRTGYSVKIVNSDFYEKPVRVGGKNASEDIILNPPSTL
jgi:hypothetical protein